MTRRNTPKVLVVDGRPVAPATLARTRRERARGLLGRPAGPGAMVLHHTRSVHTIGMLRPIEVALCDADLRVHEVITLAPYRITRPRRGVRTVVEAEVGAFARWGLVPGSRLDVVPHDIGSDGPGLQRRPLTSTPVRLRSDPPTPVRH